MFVFEHLIVLYPELVKRDELVIVLCYFNTYFVPPPLVSCQIPSALLLHCSLQPHTETGEGREQPVMNSKGRLFFSPGDNPHLCGAASKVEWFFSHKTKPQSQDTDNELISKRNYYLPG